MILIGDIGSVPSSCKKIKPDLSEGFIVNHILILKNLKIHNNHTIIK